MSVFQALRRWLRLPDAALVMSGDWLRAQERRDQTAGEERTWPAWNWAAVVAEQQRQRLAQASREKERLQGRS